ncbi:MAG: hypothetical protein JSV82_08520 [Planctomycetota bacterium]|nr:MAG: hypothetical protein JSV82_08520 [Planctomycetota bacterium]
MKKIAIVVAILALATPAIAAVDINAVPIGTTGVVAITYTTDANISAFALDITVDAGVIDDINNFHIGESNSTAKGYGIFPGSIDINSTDNKVDDYGNPVAPNDDPGALGGLDTNGITIEMGALYEDGNQPPLTGTLCNVIVTASCNITVALNTTRGGVVKEDSADATTNLPITRPVTVSAGPSTCTISGTVSSSPGPVPVAGVTISGLPGNPVTDVNGYYIATVDYGWSGTATPIYIPSPNTMTFDPCEMVYSNVTCSSPGPNNQNYDAIQCLGPGAGAEYNYWVSLNRPQCWCYSKQHCRGDINGQMEGPYWVGYLDLGDLLAAMNKFDFQLPASLPNSGLSPDCANLNHLVDGPYRVSYTDLGILLSYLNQFGVTDCPMGTTYNFWVTAP